MHAGQDVASTPSEGWDVHTGRLPRRLVGSDQHIYLLPPYFAAVFSHSIKSLVASLLQNVLTSVVNPSEVAIDMPYS
jgi:hypothetical protein